MPVPHLELARDPARRADRQPLLDPFDIGEKEDQLDVAGLVLDQHLERSLAIARRAGDARRRAPPASRSRRAAASRIFGRARRSIAPSGRWNSTSMTRAPCGRPSNLSNSLAFFGPTPGSALAGANRGSRRAGRIARIIRARGRGATPAASDTRSGETRSQYREGHS